MKLIIARHAETNYNVKELTNYEPEVDVHLTPKGIEQAEKLANELKNEKIDLIITSRLKRTKQTADIVNQNHEVDIIEDRDLDDTRNGFEGKSITEAREWRDKQKDPITAKLSDEWESVQDVNERVRSFLNKVKNRKEKTILIVTSSHLVKHFKLINESLPIEIALGKSAPHAEFYEIEMESVK